MFDPGRLREALCIVAMQCTHRDNRPIDSGSVFAKLCILMRADRNLPYGTLHMEDVVINDAEIKDCRNITATVRRLLRELNDPHTLIV